MRDLIGKRLGHYEIRELISVGGMGAVYEGYDPHLEREVAIKVLPRHFVADQMFVNRFKLEAKAIARLSHRHILPVYDSGEQDGYHYIVMRLVKSRKTLAHYLRGQPLPMEHIHQVISEIGEALSYAHKQGVIHRDVKPSNILVSTEGYYLLADFGIAKIRESTQHLTDPKAIVGTPVYISPEQIRGQKLDSRSDIYSLGVVLYEMATGRPPFHGDTQSLYAKHLFDPPPPPRNFNPNLSEAMQRVILKSLAKNLDERYSTTRAMTMALRDTGPVTPEKATRLMEDTKPIVPLAKQQTPEVVEQIDQTGEETKAKESSTGDMTEAPPPDPVDQVVRAEVARIADAQPVIAVEEQPAKTARQKSARDIAADGSEPPSVAHIELTKTDKLEKVEQVNPLPKIGMRPIAPVSRPVYPKTEPPNVAQVPEQSPTSSRKMYLAISIALVGVLILGASIIGILFWSGRSGRETPVVQSPTPGTSAALAEHDQAGETQPEPVSTSPNGTDVGSGSEQPATEETGVSPESQRESDQLNIAATEPATNQPDNPETSPVVDQLGEKPGTEQPEAGGTEPPGKASSRDLTGRLAISLVYGFEPKVYVVSTQGDLLGTLGGARQPDYATDGSKLIINGDGGPEDKLRVSDPVGNTPLQIGDPGLAGHSHPFWSPDGNQVIYDDYTVDPEKWRIFTRDLNNNQGEGTVLQASAGPIIGQNPLWASQDRFIFRGCNTWANNPGDCGIWLMQGNNGTPEKLTNNGNHIPTDVQGDKITFVSNEAGNLNVYTLDIGTKTILQLTSDPATEGLATISPDGRTVAFVSNQEGSLAVWIIDINGGTPEKLFNIPIDWGVLSSDSWFSERLTWGRG